MSLEREEVNSFRAQSFSYAWAKDFICNNREMEEIAELDMTCSGRLASREMSISLGKAA